MRSADKRVKHHPALPVAEIGTFLRELDNYANRKTALALRLLILTLTRSGEVRRGEWTEISGNTWHIPAEKMKMGLAHTVPLSDWALETLDELRTLIAIHRKFQTRRAAEDSTTSTAKRRNTV